MAKFIAWALYLTGAAAVLSAMFADRNSWDEKLITIAAAVFWPIGAVMMIAGRLVERVRRG